MVSLFDSLGALIFSQVQNYVFGNVEFWGIAIFAFFLGIMLMMKEAKADFKLLILVCAVFLAGVFLPIIMLLGVVIVAGSLMIIYKRVTGW